VAIVVDTQIKLDGHDVGMMLKTLREEMSPTVARSVLMAAELVRSAIVLEIQAWTATSDARKSGALMRSFRPSVVREESGEITAGVYSDLPYARIHETGGTITPKAAKALTVPFPHLPIGAQAADFPDAFVWRSADGAKAYLARTVGKSLELLFSLRDSVTIRAKKYLTKAAKRSLPDVQAALADETDKTIKAALKKSDGKAGKA